MPCLHIRFPSPALWKSYVNGPLPVPVDMGEATIELDVEASSLLLRISRGALAFKEEEGLLSTPLVRPSIALAS